MNPRFQEHVKFLILYLLYIYFDFFIIIFYTLVIWSSKSAYSYCKYFCCLFDCLKLFTYCQEICSLIITKRARKNNLHNLVKSKPGTIYTLKVQTLWKFVSLEKLCLFWRLKCEAEICAYFCLSCISQSTHIKNTLTNAKVSL